MAQKPQRAAFCLAALSNPLPRDLIACHALLCPFRLHPSAPVFALPFLPFTSPPPTIFCSPCLTLTTRNRARPDQEPHRDFDFDSPCFPKERKCPRPTGIYPKLPRRSQTHVAPTTAGGRRKPQSARSLSLKRLDQHRHFFASHSIIERSDRNRHNAGHPAYESHQGGQQRPEPNRPGLRPLQE